MPKAQRQKARNRGLTDKQKQFCQEYDIDLNATQAALRAGYAASSVRWTGCTNLTKPNVRAELERLQAVRRKKTGYKREQAEQEYEDFRLIAIDRKDVSGGVQAVKGKARLYGLDVDRQIKTDTGSATQQAILAAIERSKARVRQVQSIVKAGT